VVLAHAKLTVPEFVEGDVHLGHLACDHVVTGDELIARQFQRPHRVAPGQDREALCLDELAVLVEQRVQDARVDGIGIFLDVHQRGVAPASPLRSSSLFRQMRARASVAAAGQDRAPCVDQVPRNSATYGASAVLCAEQLRPESAACVRRGRALPP
jgi:hypothetical protein